MVVVFSLHVLILSTLLLLAAPTMPPTLFSTITLSPSDTPSNYSISVRGAFFCRFQHDTYPDAKIRLLSNMRYVDEKPNIRHIVDGTQPNQEGTFELQGENHDPTTLFRPVLVIYHQCGQLKRKHETFRRFLIHVPQVYVNSNATFDIGRLNLNVFYPGQKEGIKFGHFTKPMTVTGELFCTSNPNAVKIVRLFASAGQEEDSLITELTLQGNTFTVDSGRSKLDAPLIRIIHQCELSQDSIAQGLYRQFVIHVPFFYHNAGRVGLRDFQIGKLGLQLEYPAERTKPLSDL